MPVIPTSQKPIGKRIPVIGWPKLNYVPSPEKQVKINKQK
jgi:hypothetical protein